jgi:uncharacterized repeat protein (TIGR03803 family)
MKTPFLLAPLLAVLNLIPAGRVMAQTFAVLHSFTATHTDSSDVYTNTEGANPLAGLIADASGNTLYGAAEVGGRFGNGTVFKLNTDGTGFTNLHSFTYGSDGAGPRGGLLFTNNTLYGTAGAGGGSGAGTVFALNANGTGFTNLYSFTGGSDGASPYAGLILSGNTLFGTTVYGGGSHYGTVFAVNTDGTGFTNLHSFTYGSDGALPLAPLILSGSTLYGTAGISDNSVFGSGNGTVFSLNGTALTTLHSFTLLSGLSATNSDGANPYGGLILSGSRLYGTAVDGGSSGNGTVFALNTDGTSFTNLHTFIGSSDGATPYAGLILSGNTLYGTTRQGGISGIGTVFSVNTDGTGFRTLYSFTAASTNSSGTYTNADGYFPYAGLILLGGSLYGTTEYGGSSGNGTVFSISFPPQLTITPSGIPPSGIILSWPTNVAGFDYTGYTLQSTPNLVSPLWTTNSPAPVVIAGQNTVTIPITGAQQFYRLKH